MLRAAVGTTRRETGTLSGRKRQGHYVRTRARHQDPGRIPDELERAILSIRRRLHAHAAPATRYCSIGATAIGAELKALGVCPLPCGWTIELAMWLSDCNWASLMCRRANVRLQLLEQNLGSCQMRTEQAP
jgi:hypothetical protein